MTYNVSMGTLNPTIPYHTTRFYTESTSIYWFDVSTILSAEVSRPIILQRVNSQLAVRGTYGLNVGPAAETAGLAARVR